MAEAAPDFHPTGRSPAASEVPFEPLLAPMVSVARARLGPLMGTTRFSRDAWRALERYLFDRLSSTASQALSAVFARSRRAPPDIRGLLVGRPASPSTERFDAFVRRHLDDGYRSLFLEFPVLGRLLATTVDQWVAAVTEFAGRFTRDWGGPAGERAARLRPGLSDPHAGGRAVIAVELESGTRFVYKPRPMDGEALFERLVDWSNRNAPAGWLPLTAPAVRARDGYGWVEAVEPRDCSDAAEARRYFQRLGQLLCLFHALQTTDVNCENLLACGEHPVLVDAETLMQPRLSENATAHLPEALAAASRSFFESVAAVGLLPAWQWNPGEGTPFDLSGMAVHGPEPAPVRVPFVYNVNTDDMLLVNAFGALPEASNLPRLDGHVLEAADFTGDLANAFERTYGWLESWGRKLLDASGIGEPLRSFRPRVVLRATRTYDTLLTLALRPDLLRDGFVRSVELDRISLAFLRVDGTSLAAPLLDAELEALEQGDVPYFTVPAGARDWREAQGVFDESACEAASRALNRLSTAGLREQVAIIRGTFAAQRAHLPRQEEPAETAEPALDEPPLATPAALIQAAEEIAVGIRSGVSPDVASWSGVRTIPGSDRYRYEPLGEDLYSGRSGIALFLAALSAVTGSSEDEELIDRALEFARGGWKEGSAAWRRTWPATFGIGALHGIASLAYALLAARRFLGRADLEQHAIDLARTLTPEVVSAGADCSVASGTAGALIVLLRLFGQSGSQELLRAARHCGELLLARRTDRYGSRRAWPYRGGAPLAGFYLGAAGIGYALAELGRIASDERYLDAAAEAFAYEDTLFDPSARNWRDLRPVPPGIAREPFMTAWCHGSPGIALARFSFVSTRDQNCWRRDLEEALATTAGHPLDDVDHLCCGNLGRLDVLWTCGRGLGRTDLQDEVRRRSSWIVERARRARSYRLAPGVVGVAEAPSLLRGSAGIGYQLLRIARPDLVPSVLLLE